MFIPQLFNMELKSVNLLRYFTALRLVFRKNRPIFLAITLACFSCTTPSPKSEWSILKQAAGVDCEEFDNLEDDISINNVRPLDSNNHLYIATHVKRNGQEKLYLWQSKDTGSIKLKNPNEIVIGSDQFIVEVGDNTGSEEYLVLLKPSLNGGSGVLELRAVPENVVKYSTPLNLTYDSRIKYYAGRKGLWFVGSDDKTEIFYIPYKTSVESSSTTALNPILSEIAADHIELTLINEGEEALISFISRGSEEGAEGENVAKMSPAFSFKRLSGPTKKVTDLQFSAEEIKAGDIESWNIKGNGSALLYLTFISGDSLSGSAEVNTALLEIGTSSIVSKWLKKTTSQDAHIADPIVVAHQDHFEAGFLQWLDEESTLNLTSVDASGNLVSNYHGVFAQSTVLMELRNVSNSSVKIAFMNENNENGSRFKLCKIE